MPSVLRYSVYRDSLIIFFLLTSTPRSLYLIAIAMLVHFPHEEKGTAGVVNANQAIVPDWKRRAVYASITAINKRVHNGEQCVYRSVKMENSKASLTCQDERDSIKGSL